MLTDARTAATSTMNGKSGTIRCSSRSNSKKKEGSNLVIRNNNQKKENRSSINIWSGNGPPSIMKASTLTSTNSSTKTHNLASARTISSTIQVQKNSCEDRKKKSMNTQPKKHYYI